MTRKTFMTTAIIFLASLTLWTCNKYNVACSDSETFCALVDDQTFNATGPLIDNFLSTLDKKEHHENLEKLKDWLECKNCVEKVDIYCKSCIYTNPAKSEFRVDFVSDGQTTTMILSILMDEPQKFLSFR